MRIRAVKPADIKKWQALSHEHDRYVRELVPDLTEWYEGNDSALSFDAYMQSKIDKQEAFMAIDPLDNCLGVIAISVMNNRITFFAVSHKSDVQSVGNALMEYALEKLDDSIPISINEIMSTAPQIQRYRELYLKFGFAYSCDSIEICVPVNTFIKKQMRI